MWRFSAASSQFWSVTYHIEVDQKRLGRRIAELKFRITKVKKLPIQESLFPDIENLPAVAVELVQAGIDRKIALKIAKREWDFVQNLKKIKKNFSQ